MVVRMMQICSQLQQDGCPRKDIDVLCTSVRATVFPSLHSLLRLCCALVLDWYKALVATFTCSPSLDKRVY